MDNMHKTIISHNLTKTPESNYGSWLVFILLFIFVGIYFVWIVNKYFFSIKESSREPSNNTNILTGTPSGTPSGTPHEIYKNSSNINENNVILKDDNNLNNVLDNKPQSNTAPIANDSYINNSSKTGWCYIGEEGGNRSCIDVGDNDLCMSGNIFPSQEICINPSLRS